jgi:secreted trypsin-like serine protease
VHGRRLARLALPLLAAIALLAPALSQGEDAHTSVVGGTSAEAGEYPWQIALLKKQGNSLYFICGGTLIGVQRVVTAAHCTSGSAGSLKVLVGTQLLNSGGSILNVTSYADHPSYSSRRSRFDAATLELGSSAVTAGGQTMPLIGPEGSADDGLWAPGDMLAISGWGSTSEGGSIPNQLREARVPRVSDITCGQSDYYGSAFHAPTMVCAGFAAGGVDTCQGDSGGPLAASTQDPLPTSESNPSQWRLAGITSWGDGCARPKKPGV